MTERLDTHQLAKVLGEETITLSFLGKGSKINPLNLHETSKPNIKIKDLVDSNGYLLPFDDVKRKFNISYNEWKTIIKFIKKFRSSF
ncbi:hypothetical protein AM501_09995 [Aneurinibacillus migulanus]|uniref:hypothetical protein n=1 Tax=Aneurinibacillus migulanus TaxID=47500 RepID=UPI0005B7C86E|nr:hypothetical protein [Aneurinibacillus migulanus]KIV56474.1 hypothetical protein TS64_09410 [Aneurinibacillus migulanus]KPD08482.1 hypothetical protein AM501_09995 [Aneurinibacillus migulanus]